MGKPSRTDIEKAVRAGQSVGKELQEIVISESGAIRVLFGAASITGADREAQEDIARVLGGRK